MIKLKFNLLLTGIAVTMIACNGPKEIVTSVSEMNIDKGWQYRKANDSVWSSASVPGNVHTDLLNDRVIEDPFYRLNEKNQQWIGETDWEYETRFEVSDQMLEEQNINLVFEGLDTYADVYLNEEKILAAKNMFRTWDVDVRAKLKRGQNTLRIYFHNVFKINRPKYDNAEYRLQAFRNNDQADVKLNLYSRKAGFHYGWDWGPRLITAGIWRPIKLKSWSDFKIDNVFYKQKKVTTELAEISAEFEISSTSETTADMVISHEGKPLATQMVTLKPGANTIVVPMKIEQPKLWWTNGLGEQPLYTFETTIKSKDGATDMMSKRIGIRSLEIVRDDDEFGKSLYVKLNGVPVFMKGANYIPQDNFQNRVTKERYEHILGSAKEANMNMIRVWGGGIYEEDIFYDLCDEKGLLVWQDIMFACGMYPSDDDFLENVRNEVVDNVTRLRNHPSIALFCGNNENEISWYSWGWKELYEEDVQKQYEADLKKLFYKTIPNAIAEAHPDIYYHPTSPIAGIGDDRPKEDGDTHYWGVWHGKEPFKNFEENVSRFVSEYGFQSYPEFASIKKFSIKEDWFLESDVMRSHQRCMADEGKDLDYGNRLINTYLERNFNKPKDFENYVYVVQALQAKGVKIAVESHRRNRTDNYCMGTLYWQIDDCWPAASWSSIDYYGKWKALHYQMKKTYGQILVAPLEKEGKLIAYIVSDELNPIENAKISAQVLDFEGNQLWSKTETVTIAPNTSQEYLAAEVEDLLKETDRKSAYVKMTVSSENKVLSENRYFFKKDRDLDLPKANITYTAKPVDGGFEMTLTSDKLAKYVYIATENDDLFLSDNYFDMDGGTTKVIKVETKSEVAEIATHIKIISLTDSYDGNGDAVK
ncbi:glycoside hydrolase family 2 protein [Flagellimonas sp. HMM57]|uniref:beta-mannosidase n=1 Tax=unclassified Flagellimonas TaxID=2644544 RepID=UPI0013D7CDEF|nr:MULTISPECIES: glycoside hydrolase family 2 protein [unclassified Flagellimonas]UII77669.1 glycoside hydrolase family 2 protein [Flagellimonas sp. HMM57]